MVEVVKGRTPDLVDIASTVSELQAHLASIERDLLRADSEREWGRGAKTANGRAVAVRHASARAFRARQSVAFVADQCRIIHLNLQPFITVDVGPADVGELAE